MTAPPGTGRTGSRHASAYAGRVGRRLIASVAGTLIVMIGLAVAVFLILRAHERTTQRAILERRTAALAEEIRSAFQVPIETAHSVAALFTASVNVDRDEFHRFASVALRRENTIHALEWAPRIAGDDRDRFEAEVRATGIADFAIRDRSVRGSLAPAPRQDSYAPLLYVEPPSPVLGYDIAGDALWKACRDAAAVTGGRHVLVEDPPDVPSATVYVPAWPRGEVPASPAERCATVLGWVNLIFHLDPVLTAVAARVGIDDLDFVLRDLDAAPGSQLLGASRAAAVTADASLGTDGPTARRTLAFADRTWELVVAPRDTGVAWVPVIALVIGLLAAGLAAAIAGGVHLVSQLRRRVDDAVQLGQYVLEEELGRGGMGVVYKARHVLMRRPTALKLLDADRSSEAHARQFEREVQLTSQLSHPNTIAIYDYGRTAAGVFYYVMEYVDGVSFADLVHADGPQPVARTIHLIRQVCEALREAHDAGIVHRDLKPPNLMVTTRGGLHDVVKVLDFGLVKELEGRAPVIDLAAADAANATVPAAAPRDGAPAPAPRAKRPSFDATRLASTVQTVAERPAGRSSPRDEFGEGGAFLGTPGYASPEVVVGGATDPRSDLYAVGAVWFALLTGRPAFDGRGAGEIFIAQLNHDPPRPRRFRPDLPAALDDLIARCLSRDPGDRPASAQSILDALDTVDAPAWKPADAAAWWRDRADHVRAAVHHRTENTAVRTVDTRILATPAAGAASVAVDLAPRRRAGSSVDIP